MKVTLKTKGLHKSQGAANISIIISLHLSIRPSSLHSLLQAKTLSPPHMQGEGAFGCLLGWDLRGQAWVTHTFLVMLLGVASSYRRGDTRATKEAGEM